MRNFTVRVANVLEIFKTQIILHREYGLRFSVSRTGDWNLIVTLKAIQNRVTKLIKIITDYRYRKRLENLGFSTFLWRRMRDDLIKTFKTINGFSNYGRHFLSFLFELKIFLFNQLDFFVQIELYIFNQITLSDQKNSNSPIHLKLNWLISEIMVRKRI